MIRRRVVHVLVPQHRRPDARHAGPQLSRAHHRVLASPEAGLDQYHEELKKRTADVVGRRGEASRTPRSCGTANDLGAIVTDYTTDAVPISPEFGSDTFVMRDGTI